MNFEHIAEAAVDIANELLDQHHDTQAAAHQSSQECLAEQGRTAGAELGHAHFQAGYIQDHPEFNSDSFREAMKGCEVPSQANDGPHPFITLNPYLAVAQIVAWPSEANSYEVEAARASAVYGREFDAGYHQQASADFDQRLDSYLQPQWHAPSQEPYSPRAFDIPHPSAPAFVDSDSPASHSPSLGYDSAGTSSGSSTSGMVAPDSSSGPSGVGADSNLSHRADRILSQGWKPTLRGSAVDKFSS